MLKELFEMQQQLDERIKKDRDVKMNFDEWVLGLTVALESEIDEVRREINWKWWKQKKVIDVSKLQEEVIDIWHFVLSLSIATGLTAEKVYEVYTKKNQVNHERQDNSY